MGLAMATSSSPRVGRKAGVALVSRAYHFSMAVVLLYTAADACPASDHDYYSGDDLWLFPSPLPDTVNGVKDGPGRFYCFIGFQRCMSGIEQCVHWERECDGVKDCADGSDEGDRCKSFDCSALDRYKCPSGGVCMNVRTATEDQWRYRDLIDPYTQYLCDGVKDCADGSDEDPSFCSSYDCNEDMPHMPLRNSSVFRETLLYKSPPHRRGCPGGRGGCLVEEKLCDGVVDCVGDGGSDERDEYCKKRGCSPSSLFSLFQCESGRCINRQLVCDGKKDCPDGDDEGEFCEKMACSTKSGATWKVCDSNQGMDCPLHGNSGMKCPGSNRTCIVESQLCDGVEDCPGGTDENHCETHTCSVWPTYLKKCPSGRECAAFLICNGVKECRDGSDEDPSLCRAFNCSSPRHRLFKCKDGVTCISARAVCDGRKNCPDKSDEDPVFCRSHHDCTLPNQVKCPGSRYVWCTFPWGLCDGLSGSCYEGEDENTAFCASKEARDLLAKHERIACLSNDTLFVNGKYCDGKKDCKDGSDEREDFCESYRCPESKVKCYGRWCTTGKRCDGKRDCPDGSDEEGCTT
ncbi:hypothetical protein CBR_g34421 [Chara braunii]|uniref:Uncharacterized protein n=1 Tax=Chara braunii TaxID=69332 RepID=A0A388LII1_CHABU|nr:hypothetical protein CBR_g34421 [Chara braunii]|eukprot:GBG82140.1 hypothetical protein CBR_g34421 [Chara braunii]